MSAGPGVPLLGAGGVFGGVVLLLPGLLGGLAGVGPRRIVVHTSRKLSVFAIDSKGPSYNSCNYGASGAGVEAASGKLFSDLSVLISIDPRDKSALAVEPMSEAQKLWNQVEQELGVRVSQRQFNTLCLFSNPTVKDVRSLVSNVGNYMPEIGTAISSNGNP